MVKMNGERFEGEHEFPDSPEHSVEVHVLDPTKDYPGEHPYPLAYVIPRAELEMEWGEVSEWIVEDLLHHVKRLEGVRIAFEDLLLKEDDAQ